MSEGMNYQQYHFEVLAQEMEEDLKILCPFEQQFAEWVAMNESDRNLKVTPPPSSVALEKEDEHGLEHAEL